MPQYFDFGSGFGETWDIPLRLTNEERENQQYFPIYNFLYPLGEKFTVPTDFRKRLAATTIIEMGDRHYLALTSCGMDYTWEIVESHVQLGYYPPVHFARLPLMVDRGDSRSDRRLIAACRASLDAMIRRCELSKGHLDLI